MFKICPDCRKDKLKFKVQEKRTYDPATTRMLLEEEIPVVEYHCPQCGWTILVEDPPLLPQEELRQSRS